MGRRQQPRQRFEFRRKVLRGVRSFTYTYIYTNCNCNSNSYSYCYSHNHAQRYSNSYSQTNAHPSSERNTEDTAHSAAAAVENNCRLVLLQPATVSPMQKDQITGGCYCGEVRFSATPGVRVSTNC